MLLVVITVTLGFAAMALVAYALGRVTCSEWVWWLAPLTVAVEGTFLLRARVANSAAILPAWGTHTFADLEAPIYLASSVVAAGTAAFGAYTGNRPAIVIGAILAILWKALERAENGTYRGRGRDVQGSHPARSPSS
jgi:hypothetical protein